jgi:hypothetical protein
LYSPSDFEKNNVLSNSDGINFDFEKDFFSNYKKLLQSIPLMSLRQFPPISNSFFTDAS